MDRKDFAVTWLHLHVEPGCDRGNFYFAAESIVSIIRPNY